MDVKVVGVVRVEVPQGPFLADVQRDLPIDARTIEQLPIDQEGELAPMPGGRGPIACYGNREKMSRNSP